MTRPLRPTNNVSVHRFVTRAVAGLVVGPFLALACAFTPAHAHAHEADHSASLIHSHFELHESTPHPDAPEVERGSERVVWLENAIIHASPYQLDPPLAIVVGNVELSEASAEWSVAASHESVPAHGPPRQASSLRGPPSIPA